MGIIGWIVLGGLAGWVASMIAGTNAQQGLLGNIVAGVIGGVVGGFVFNLLGGTGVTGFNLWSFLVALVGAVIATAMRHPVTRAMPMVRPALALTAPGRGPGVPIASASPRTYQRSRLRKGCDAAAAIPVPERSPRDHPRHGIADGGRRHHCPDAGRAGCLDRAGAGRPGAAGERRVRQGVHGGRSLSPPPGLRCEGRRTRAHA